jgi:hypothetical protein
MQQWPEEEQLTLLIARKHELKLVVDQISRIRVWFGKNDEKLGCDIGNLDASLEDAINEIEDAIWSIDEEIDNLEELLEIDDESLEKEFNLEVPEVRDDPAD